MENIIKTKIFKKTAKRGSRRNVKGEGVKKRGLLFTLLSSALMSCAFSVVLILVYALLLYKQILPANSMSFVNATIKVLSSMLAAFIVTRKRTNKLWLLGAMGGGVYTLGAFLIFSVMSSTLNMSLSLLLDLVMCVFSGMLFAMVMNIFKR